MSKKFLILIVLMVLLNACQYLGAGEDKTGEVITGEVIEISPAVDIIVNLDEVETEELPEVIIEEPEDKYADILIRIETTEGDTVTLKPDAYDPDGDLILYTFTEPFDENGIWKTEEGDADQYVVTVTASDGTLSTSEDILVTVKPTNKAPKIECPDELSFEEGDVVLLECNIFDPENDTITIEYSGWLSSAEYKTGYDDEGDYEVNITASDGNRTTSKTIDITVEDVNRLPEVSGLDDFMIEEGANVTLDIEVSDADKGDVLSIGYSEPFDGDGFWQTEIGDSKTYEAYVIVDDGKDEVKETFTIIVTQQNTAPTLEYINPIMMDEGDILDLNVLVDAYDREGDELTIAVSGWFETMSYQSTYNDAGNHTINVTVSDGQLLVFQEVEIIVNDVNRGPVWFGISGGE